MSEPMHVHGRFGMTWGGHRAGVTFVITDPMTQGDTGRVIEVEADTLESAMEIAAGNIRDAIKKWEE